jgi:hypothetical protein
VLRLNKPVPPKQQGKRQWQNSSNNLLVLLHNKEKWLLVSNWLKLEFLNKPQIKQHYKHNSKLNQLLATKQLLVVVNRLVKHRKPLLWVLVVLAQLLLQQCPELLWPQMLVLVELVNLQIYLDSLLLLIFLSEAPNG